MNTFFTKVFRFFRLFLAFFPTKLPIGDPQFDKWSKDIIDLYGLPDNDSGRWALCGMIMHLPPQSYRVSKRYFGITGLKSLSNQTVYAIMGDIKGRQEAQQKAAAEEQAKANGIAKPAEVTAPTVPSGQS